MSDERKLIEVNAGNHKRLKEEAINRGIQLKRLGNMIVDYGLNKLESGDLEVVEKLESATAGE